MGSFGDMWRHDRGLLLIIVGAILALLLVLWLSYDHHYPGTATWRNICTDSSSVYMGQQPIIDGDGRITGTIPQYQTFCNRYEVQCRPGRDGTSRCDWERPSVRPPGFI